MAEYRFPTADLLKDSTESSKFQRLEYVQQLRDRLNGMFASFGTDVKVVDYHYNNFAILMKLQLGRGVKAQTVKNLRADIELHAGDPVEFMDSADGKTITIAVKNFQRPVVPLREVIASAAFREAKSPVSVAAGINLFGNAFVFDIATMPNLLVAGVTGSGKSIFLHDIILSILFKARPEEVKLLLFDMKKVEFPLMNGIPHMLQDTITDTDHGMDVMMWLRDEVDHRLFRMAMANAPSIDEYEYIRQKTEEAYEAERVDMFNATLESIALHSRETGIHLILATQRPTPDIITDRIKGLLPCRASFVVVDKRESTIILNRTGAERLLGQGDMIFTRNDSEDGIHAQAAYVSDEEISRVIEFLRTENSGD